jgi:hypothetical protein
MKGDDSLKKIAKLKAHNTETEKETEKNINQECTKLLLSLWLQNIFTTTNSS